MNTDERRCPDSLTEKVIGAVLVEFKARDGGGLFLGVGVLRVQKSRGNAEGCGLEEPRREKLLDIIEILSYRRSSAFIGG